MNVGDQLRLLALFALVARVLLLLKLGAPVLEPGLDLRLSQPETLRKLEPLVHVQVDIALELVLEPLELHRTVRLARFSLPILFPVALHQRGSCNREWMVKQGSVALVQHFVCAARGMHVSARKIVEIDTLGEFLLEYCCGKSCRALDSPQKLRCCLVDIQESTSFGFHESFVEIHSYESSVMSDSNLESNLQRFMNLQRITNL